MQVKVNTSSLLEEIINNNNYKKYYDKIKEISSLNEKINNLTSILASDLFYIYNNITESFDVDINYNINTNELNISISFIQSSSILEDDLFDKAIEYYDKYEEYLINRDLYDIVIDFNVTTKNENVKHVIVFSSDNFTE